ncbi:MULTISPECIES: hypothetical protein [unclassified Streptomyces]|uniref:hypothetical protein n=1 Tax=unclassified Streptomyces TaxID=2593676 RepID=UPI002DD8F191|nr:hypothetical protein [Streptomyces sp. NBC_00243]WRZ20226.1 hypothetical protein OHT59_17850 [Streptomyces sp. NBC_00243]
MGERQSGGGTPDRRVAHPAGEEPVVGARPADDEPGAAVRPAGDDPAPVEPPANDDPTLLKPLAGDPPIGEMHPPGGEDPAAEVLLDAVRRRVVSDAGAEARAVAAFRAARDAGVHAVRPARSRRRDDWRPREQRKVGRSLRTTLAVLFASLTLGGVAVAAIGSVSDDGGADRDDTRLPSSSAAPERSGPASANPAPSGPGQAAPSGHPSQAQDTEAHCRAYDAVKGRGKALGSTAWQRLIDAAGGEGNVEAYCAGQLDHEATGSPGKADSTPKATPKPKKSKDKG